MNQRASGRHILCRRPLSNLVAVIVLLSTGLGCQRSTRQAAGPTLAVTTSYLESAVRDLLGEEITVLRLAEPGSCPGHFDVRPSQVAELKRCQGLVRFDFQRSLDAVLSRDGPDRLPVIEVTLRDGLCKPASYLAGCRQLANAAAALGWLEQAKADARLEAVRARLAVVEQAATNQVIRAGLAGTPVLASTRQKEFCEWLGLKVVACFRAADTASVAEIDRAITQGELAGVRLVVANLPEGRRTADALAERLGTKVVVFGNFPGEREGRVCFDEVVRQNVEALLAAAPSRTGLF